MLYIKKVARDAPFASEFYGSAKNRSSWCLLVMLSSISCSIYSKRRRGIIRNEMHSCGDASHCNAIFIPLCLLILHLKTSKGVNGKLLSTKRMKVCFYMSSHSHYLVFCAAQVHRKFTATAIDGIVPISLVLALP
jgi:hypothetical protein